MSWIDRRQFLSASAALALRNSLSAMERFDLYAIERPRVIKQADQFLHQQPITITAYRSPRSAGGLHDYFSEGDYWWPNPKDPNGPYIRRDGMSNPDNFVAHRRALMRLSVQCPALCAAWLLTKERKLRGSRCRASAGLVYRSKHLHESEPAIRTGDPRNHHRAGNRHYRYSPARGRSSGSGRYRRFGCPDRQ